MRLGWKYCHLVIQSVHPLHSQRKAPPRSENAWKQLKSKLQ
jgi:hypothetical protein